MSAGIQRNDIQQYCSLEDASVKSLSNSYMQFSPTSSTDWWAPIKSVGSPKDSWSSDSDSSQQTIIGNGTDGSVQDMQSPDYSLNLSSTTDDLNGSKKKKKSKDTPAVNKPAQVVARRNARERRRVQAVNGAFQRLRKVVPIEENKSKRMSKVKTLQLAIEYINQLQGLLQLTTHHTTDADLLADIFSDFQQQQHVKLEPSEYTTFRVPTSFYNHLIGENGEN